VAEYIEEEIGHEEWILDDIAAAGGDAEAARASRPELPAEVMVAYAYDLVQPRQSGRLLRHGVRAGGHQRGPGAAAADLIQQAWSADRRFPTCARTARWTRSTPGTWPIWSTDGPGRPGRGLRCARVFYKLYGDIFRALPGTREKPHMELNNARILLTGATGGLGQELAHAAGRGAGGSPAGRARPARWRKLSAAGGTRPGTQKVCAPTSTSRRTSRSLPGGARFRVNVLINNAGIGGFGLFDQQDWGRRACWPPICWRPCD
jgi:hypothetical protein